MSDSQHAAGPLPGSESVAFCLRLRPGCEAAEYQRRHDALWPEMRQALLEAGGNGLKLPGKVGELRSFKRVTVYRVGGGNVLRNMAE